MKFIFLLLSLCCFSYAEITNEVLLPFPFSSVDHLYFDLKTNSLISLQGKFQRDHHSRKGQNLFYKEVDGIDAPVEILRGTSLLLLEWPDTSAFLFHFFHLLEHLVGIWGSLNQEQRGDVNRIILMSDGNFHYENWQGPNQINAHLIQALFPKAEVFTLNQFKNLSQGCLIEFEKAVLSDRELAHRSKEVGKLNKMLAEARHSITPESLEEMAQAVWKYAQVSKNKLDKFCVTYAKRCSYRHLIPEKEQELLVEISKLPNVELRVIDYADMSFQEQIQADYNTDLLISVHGNGLSHALFLPKGATVIEIFPRNTQCLCYRMFCDMRGLSYHGYHEDRGFVDAKTAYGEGEYGNMNQPISEVNVAAIVEVIPFFVQKQQLPPFFP